MFNGSKLMKDELFLCAHHLLVIRSENINVHKIQFSKRSFSSEFIIISCKLTVVSFDLTGASFGLVSFQLS